MGIQRLCLTYVQLSSITSRDVLRIAAAEEYKVPKESFREDHLLCPDLGLC